MNSVNLTKLSSAILVGLALTACGGGSSNNEQTSNGNNQKPSEKLSVLTGFQKISKLKVQVFMMKSSLYLMPITMHNTMNNL